MLHRFRIVGERSIQHEGEAELAAAVGDVVEDLAVALGAIDRPQHEPVDLVLDHAARVAGCALDIHDTGVARVGRVELAFRHAAHALIGAGVAELRAVGERFDFGRAHVGDAGLCGICACERQYEKNGPQVLLPLKSLRAG